MLRRVIAPLFIVAVLFLLVTCGDDEDEPTPTSTEAPTATATPTEESASGAEPTAGDAAGIVDPPARSDEIPRDGRVIGADDAPVLLVEYGDFQ